MRCEPLWRVSVETTPAAEEALAELLETLLRQTPSTYLDVQTGKVTVTVFLSNAPKPLALRAELRDGLQRLASCGLHPGSGRLSITKVPKQDWSQSWKRHFKPFTVGRALLIKPSWSRRKPAPGQSVIVIDPGLSFGTGQHPTTRFCLGQLAAARRPQSRQSFLDVGTGSGILAIAAAKLGYRPVRALDFDRAAVRAARQNAKKNAVTVAVTRQDITAMAGPGQYDVVCANLTADLLENCAGKLTRSVKPGGLLVLAGILRVQIDSVQRSFGKRGFGATARSAHGQWESLALAQQNPCGMGIRANASNSVENQFRLAVCPGRLS